MFGLGSSNKTIKTYIGLDVGNTDANVLILLFEYFPPTIFWAVPVFPPTWYPLIFANPAVPIFVETTFRKMGFIFSETPSFKILFLVNFFDSFCFISDGLISYPPLAIIEYPLASWSGVVVIPCPNDDVASLHFPHLNDNGSPTSSISNSILSKIPIFFKNNLNFSIPIFWAILTDPILPDLIKISSAVKSDGISSSYSLIGLPAQVKFFGKFSNSVSGSISF